jgi:phosphoglycolate phosphatase/putative hydrolase of the HAD superfamily
MFSEKDFNFQLPKAFIFDVDGTLYDQSRLRLFMLLEVITFLALHPLRAKDFKILLDFRKNRELNEFDLSGDIDNQQYLMVAQRSGVTPKRVRHLVQNWMFERPLKYLPRCLYPGVLKLFSNLQERNISIGVFSDYPSQSKLDVLGLSADVTVCSADKEVDFLKPNPKGLLITAKKLGVPIYECLFIGDRDDKDGECARRAGMRCLILDKKNPNAPNRFGTYHELNVWLNSV